MPRPGPIVASAAYQQSVADQTAHHARSKTFSGSLLVPYIGDLAALLTDVRAESILDYGAGKQAMWIKPLGDIEGLYSIKKISLFDPCVPGLADESSLVPHDVVILSHVLFWIPLADLTGWVLPRIAALATKGMLIIETIGDEKKRILSDRDAHPRGLHAVDWIDLLLPYRAEGRPIRLITEYRGADGRIYAGRWEL